MDNRTAPPTLARRPNWLRLARVCHHYLGVVFAPLILLFAFSGSLQVLGLQDADRETGQEPPAWIQVLASVHKHQRIVVRAPDVQGAADRTGAQREAGNGMPADGERRGHRRNPLLFKALVLAMAFSLICSTLLGLYIGFAQSRRRGTLLALFAAGIAVPLLLLLI